MQSYTKSEQSFLLYHGLLCALFAAAQADEQVSSMLRRRIFFEMPTHIADHLMEVINHIAEQATDDRSSEDQTP
jgi:hypothetical protein